MVRKADVGWASVGLGRKLTPCWCCFHSGEPQHCSRLPRRWVGVCAGTGGGLGLQMFLHSHSSCPFHQLPPLAFSSVHLNPWNCSPLMHIPFSLLDLSLVFRSNDGVKDYKKRRESALDCICTCESLLLLHPMKTIQRGNALSIWTSKHFRETPFCHVSNKWECQEPRQPLYRIVGCSWLGTAVR